MKATGATIAEAGRNFVEDLTTSARENPVSAALIGMGVLWMFAGSKNVGSWARAVPAVPMRASEAAASVVEAGARGVASGVSLALATAGGAASQVTDAVAGGARELGTVVGDVGQGVTNALDSSTATLGNTARQVAHSIDSGVRSSVASGQEHVTSLQKTLADLFERQPLALGALGLAIGAGIASSFVATTAERQFMGEAAASAKEKLVGVVNNTSEAAGAMAQNTIEELQREAQRQGLTTATAEAGLNQASEKLKGLADVAQGSLRNRSA